MIYFIYDRVFDCIKIGTTRDYHERMKQLQASKRGFELLGLMDGDRKTEQLIHQTFEPLRISRSEWFHFDPALLEYIKANTHKNVPGETKGVTIRVSPRTLAALDIFMGKLRAKTSSRITQDKAIWEALTIADPEAIRNIESITDLESIEESSEEDTER